MRTTRARKTRARTRYVRCASRCRTQSARVASASNPNATWIATLRSWSMTVIRRRILDDDIPTTGVEEMRWVTRKNASVDRIACPWLIKRFIDPTAEFIYVEAHEVDRVAREQSAEPFDVEGAELGHVDGRCSFDSLLLKYRLVDPALASL